MVNYGADAIFEIGSNIDEDDLEEMIKNGEDKAKKLSDQAEDIMKEKFDMVNFEMNTCNLYQFEDVDYLKEKRKDAEALLQKNVIALMDQEHADTGGRRKVKKNMAESNICPNIFAISYFLFTGTSQSENFKYAEIWFWTTCWSTTGDLL